MLRNRIYYRIKPFVPQAMRTAIRRNVAARLRHKVTDVWPTMPGSERPPEHWQGWPGNKKFSFVLTHDVESAAGLQRCRKLMRLEMELGFRSSFNFVPEGDYRVPRELREELQANGFEIGIHDLNHDGRLYQSRRDFNQKAARINDYLREWKAVGFRSAFMMNNLDWLHELQIRYDASTFDTDPFEPQPEGRHTIFPFWVPSPGPQKLAAKHQEAQVSADGRALTTGPDRSRSGYVELPYTLPQDSTLFLLLREQTVEVWLRKLSWLVANGGMVLLDTHPDYMSFSKTRPDMGEYPIGFYRAFLEHVRSEYAGQYWHALPSEVASFISHEKTPPLSRDYPRVSPDLNGSGQSLSSGRTPAVRNRRLQGKRAAVLLFSYYPDDPRPRRAAEALVAEGVTVDLLCLQKTKSEPRREIINGINIFRVPLRRRRRGKGRYIGQYSLFILRSFLFLALRSIRRRYDFVHVHNMPDVLVFSAIIPKALGAKLILDLHDPMPELMQTIFELPEESGSVRLLKRLERWSISFADLVLTVNAACKRIYSSRSCPVEKIRVVLNSPEDDVFRLQAPALAKRNGARPAEPFTILYHGSLVHRNGFDLAIDALEKARESVPNARLVVCGERTAFFDQTMAMAEKRGIAEHIEYLGPKNRREVVEAINHCDLGIIPNHRNIFTEINTPTRIFEYLALGKPVIAPRAPGICDYFAEGDLVFFELGDANDLARKIDFAYSCPAETREIVERGQRVYQAHQWSQQRINLLDAISEMF
jgi:glycosyltransferase involved in cell wall biosynthesis